MFDFIAIELTADMIAILAILIVCMICGLALVAILVNGVRQKPDYRQYHEQRTRNLAGGADFHYTQTQQSIHKGR